MTLPNFLIIGAMKAGTTSVYQYMGQHPEIFTVFGWEPQFFAFEGESLNFRGPGDEKLKESVITDRSRYEDLFQWVQTQKAAGEKSTAYLYHPQAAARIHKYIPDVRLIAILREPAARAYSNYTHMVRDLREPNDNFLEALADEPQRIADNWAFHWHYQHLGLYYEQLKRYFDIFSPSQIKVYLFEDLRQDPVGLLQDICAFLEVDDTFVPDTSFRYNVSGIPRWKCLQRFLIRPNPLKALLRNFIPAKTRDRLRQRLVAHNLERQKAEPLPRNELRSVFRNDILKLQDLIDRDLSAWLA